MTISLRKHQQRILDRMLAYEKGQIIVPTGGGKTLTMILDTQRRHDVINNGTTTVVVAPRILLAEQFAVSSWKLLTLPTLTSCTFIVVRLITLAAPRQTRFTCLLMLQELLVRMLSSSPPTILCIVSKRQTLR